MKRLDIKIIISIIESLCVHVKQTADDNENKNLQVPDLWWTEICGPYFHFNVSECYKVNN